MDKRKKAQRATEEMKPQGKPAGFHRYTAIDPEEEKISPQRSNQKASKTQV